MDSVPSGLLDHQNTSMVADGKYSNTILDSDDGLAGPRSRKNSVVKKE